MGRPEKIAAQIRRKVADIVHRKVAPFKGGLVSIIEVTLSKDFAYADVYYSFLGDETGRRRAQKQLDTAAGYIKGELGKTLESRGVPTLRFVYDTSIEEGQKRIDKLNALQDPI